jgi:hypothetical protein
MQRQIFEINTDTGTQGDTGPSFHGAIAQMRWNPTTVDTGADLSVALLPKAGDTGDGWIFYNDNDCLGANFVRVPSQHVHDIDGNAEMADTGTSVSPHPIVAAGDRLRIKVTPGGAAVAGRLYIWIDD